jgi:hypothetical protein
MFGLNDTDILLDSCFDCLGPDMIGGHDSIRSSLSLGRSLSSSQDLDIELSEKDADCMDLRLCSFIA